MRIFEFMCRVFRVPRQEIVTRIVSRDQQLVTIEEWKANKDLVKLANIHLNDVGFRMMMDVLRNANFANYMLQMTGVSIEDRAFMQARGEGYLACLSNLESLGTLSLPKEQLDETYEEIERPQEQSKKES